MHIFRSLFLALTLTALSNLAQARLGAKDLAPPPFSAPELSEQAMFVDFQSAHYKIVYDITQRRTIVHSHIVFEATTEGLPVFDLINAPTSVKVDGETVGFQQVLPASDGQLLWVINSPTAAGPHTLEITHEMNDSSSAPEYGWGNVKSGFFTNDMDGVYLNYYLPTNYEFDQYSMVFDVEIIGASEEHAVFTNGQLEQIDDSHWIVTYPEYFNCSAGYFHIRPANETTMVNFEIDRGDGQMVPAVIYTTDSWVDLSVFQENAIRSMESLTTRYGIWAHPSLVVLATYSGGGMEYDGATVSSNYALKHELAHSFFGRGWFPANGNAGWIDEAMATWGGGPYTAKPNQVYPTNMSGNSDYYTQNDGNGYGHGLNLLGRWDKKFKAANSAITMDGFMAAFYQAYVYNPVVISDFQTELENYSGLSLQDDFNTYVYGAGAKLAKTPRVANPHGDWNLKKIRALY